MGNKALWNRAFTTDPKAVKAITGKQYNGNSPKPYWIVERLTDEFGPCGIGWGFTILSDRIERFSDTDSLHIAAVRMWYVFDGKRGELEQIGQTKASYLSSKDKFIVDEDAPKKSVTDALVKCASYLGFAGDIFSGRWDDSKYVAEAGAEWEARKREADPKRESILADYKEAIQSSTNGRELKDNAANALKWAGSDVDAINQINAAIEAKIATGKEKKNDASTKSSSATAMTKEEFKTRWEGGNDCGGITFDDIAECAVAWGLFSNPKTSQIDWVRYTVLRAAGTKDAEEYAPEEAEV